MLIGQVKGNLWATKKDEKLNGLKFLIVELVTKKSIDEIIVAVDNVGAGIGDFVLVVIGSSARCSLENINIPVDAVIVGIVDSEALRK